MPFQPVHQPSRSQHCAVLSRALAGSRPLCRDLSAGNWCCPLVGGGSLLGAVRENGALLEWEDDVDVSVLLHDDMTWDKLSTALSERAARDGYYVDLFEKRELIAVSFDPPRPRPFRWERNRFRGEIRVDVATYRVAVSHGEVVLERRSHKGDMPATESGGYGVPKGMVLPTSTIGFVGEEMACPRNPHAYLRALYGDFEEIEYTYIDSAAVDARHDTGSGSVAMISFPTPGWSSNPEWLPVTTRQSPPRDGRRQAPPPPAAVADARRGSARCSRDSAGRGRSLGAGGPQARLETKSVLIA